MTPLNPGIEAVGFGITGNIGGLPRQTYYTPDGRVIRAIAQMREWVRKNKDGKAVASGIRDANLDHGWLLQKPTVLKLYCKTCDRWHDTNTEVKACQVKQDRLIARSLRVANREEAKKSASLEQQVIQLQARVAKLMEGKTNGVLLQQPDNAPTGETAGRSRNGKAKAGVQ